MKLDSELMRKQIIISRIIYFNKNRKDGIPISIKGLTKSVSKDVYKYIQSVPEEEFKDLLSKVGTEQVYLEAIKHSLKANYSNNPQRQKETLVKIKYPQISNLEN